MARPKKEPMTGREQVITVRVKSEELLKIDQKAEMAGRTRSEFMRQAALRGKVVIPQKNTPDFKLIHELNKIGVNLNQLVHNSHIYKNLPQKLPEVLQKIERLVVQAAEEVNAK